MTRPDRRAFSFVEVVISMGILATILVAPHAGDGAGDSAARGERPLDETIAASLAADILDQVAASGPVGLSPEARLSTADGTLTDGVAIPGAGGARFKLPPIPAGMTATVTITALSKALRRAAVEVTRIRHRPNPTDPAGTPLSVRLVTVIGVEVP